MEVKHIGLNFADVFTVLGLYGATPKHETFIPGSFAGVCVEEGKGGKEGETSLIGKRVMGVTRFGAFATVVDVPRHQVRVIPDAWSFSEGAAFIVQSLTVYYGLSALGRIREGDVCLIHSASGGCGSQALQICDKVGAKAIAVIGDESKKGFLEKKHGGSLPASAIIVRLDILRHGSFRRKNYTFAEKISGPKTRREQKQLDTQCTPLCLVFPPGALPGGHTHRSSGIPCGA